MSCLVMLRAGGILTRSCILNGGDVGGAQENDGDVLSNMREFHILM